ncbi:hypothetical protein ONZ43_g3031 [Nemania bipapillata]|uniref:Uncharacterized protein n=1 Tax=Nemania bipapillata TaxID=110536 RepID=A0ACC2IYJ4_9PEZI|nr:hypothetical protein ONZ43_g3031 [Nemania bipapillata]
MEDVILFGDNSRYSDPADAQAVGNNNETQSPINIISDHESHQDTALVNVQLIREIRILQQRLSELERQARPALDKETLEAEWNHAREELGPMEERKAWVEQMRQQKLEFVVDPYFDLKAQRNHGDLDHMLNLLKIRKTWEQKVDRILGVDQDDTESDWDAIDEETEREVVNSRIEIARRAFNLEKDDLMRDFRVREGTRKRRFHRAQLEREREAEKARANREAVSACEDQKKQDGVGELGDGETLIEAEQKRFEEIVPNALSQVHRVPWPRFQSLRALTEGSSSAIDVLIGEPPIEFNVMPYGWRRKTAMAAKERKAVPKLDAVSEQTPMPERIRINSRHLLQILSQLNQPPTFIPPSVLPSSSIVLLRPFRILAYYNESIRERYESLGNILKTELHHEDISTRHSATFTDHVSSSTVADNSAQGKSFGAESPSKGGIVEGSESQRKDTELNSKEKKLYVAESLVVFEHMGCLINFIDTDMEKRISHLKSSKCQKVFFSDLWYLFQPGDLVIGNDGKQAYRVLTMNSIGHRIIDPLRKYFKVALQKEEEEEEEASITIKCVHIDFDGKHLGPVSKVFRIPRFEHEMAVTSLKVYPLRFHPFKKQDRANDTTVPGTELKKHLVNRGRRFLKVTAVQQTTVQPMYYAGPALQTQDEIDSQVVIDFEAAFGVDDHVKQGWKPSLETLIRSEDSDKEEIGRQKCYADCCRSEDVCDDSYTEKKMNDEFMGSLLPKTREDIPSVVIIPRPLDTKGAEASLSEDDLAIISYRVFGYVLRNRKWAQLDLTYLSEVQPSRTKDEDVNSTGKGLIILLHGAPGVGKTTTAEGVAERFKKPLFQLTCGDLGTTAKEVESALETNFALASRWGCILLLDEADVFLAQRTKEDFKRNGLVAVFLRVLEYYAGILFLTTNRVGDFDEAFASRIHISLYYPELGREETLEVFKLNLQLMQDRFKRKHRKLITNETKIWVFVLDYWNQHPFDHWNGRQIRNACQTAVALAEFESLGENDISSISPDVHLQVSHFETVAKAYLAFSEHMKDIYGTHAARRAKEAGLRAMWVNEKGDLMGNIGPKEAGMLKQDRKSSNLATCILSRNHEGWDHNTPRAKIWMILIRRTITPNHLQQDHAEPTLKVAVISNPTT